MTMDICSLIGWCWGWMPLSSYCTFSAWASSDFKLLVTFFNSSSRSPDLLSNVRKRKSKRRKSSDLKGRTVEELKPWGYVRNYKNIFSLCQRHYMNVIYLWLWVRQQTEVLAKDQGGFKREIQEVFVVKLTWMEIKKYILSFSYWQQIPFTEPHQQCTVLACLSILPDSVSGSQPKVSHCSFISSNMKRQCICLGLFLTAD